MTVTDAGAAATSTATRVDQPSAAPDVVTIAAPDRTRAAQAPASPEEILESTVEGASAATSAPTQLWAVHAEPTFDNDCDLTDAEIKVLSLSVAGATTEQIAHTMLLPVTTIDDIRRAAYFHVGAGSREEALAWALAHHLLTPLLVEPAPESDTAAA